jgi:putative transposase
MHKGYKIRLYPTREQEKLLWETINAARWTWNWALSLQMERFENGEKFLSTFDIAKELTTVRNLAENAWLKDVAKNSCKLVLFDLDKAYKRFFKQQKNGEKFSRKTIERAKRHGKKLSSYDMIGHPKFKSKGKAKLSMPTPTDNVYFKDGRVLLVKIGKVKYKTDFKIPQGKNACKVSNPRIAYENGKWLMTFSINAESNPPKLNDYCVGVDLGVKTLATISCNGQKSVVPNINKTKEVKRLEKRLKREQRKAARRIKRSKNQDKAYKQINKTYARIRNIRRDHNHKATHKIISMLPGAIGIEDLNISGMIKNRHLSKAIQDCCFYEFRRQLEYKAKRNGIKIVLADRFYPSSKRCFGCGHINKKLKLRDRVYVCDKCKLKIDRDFNAALNLERLARQTA